jgi:hypothetical protein
MDTFTVRLLGKPYVYDGHKWFGADDYMQPPQSITSQLKTLLPAEVQLAVRMQAKRAGRIELRHFLGYHSPEVMGSTAEKCNGLEFLTSRDFGNPVGDVLWFVGKAAREKKYFLRSHYVIEAVNRSSDPAFQFVFVGSQARAGVFESMQELTSLRWFQDFFPTTTCARGFGMDTIPAAEVAEFKALAAAAGHAFVY